MPGSLIAGTALLLAVLVVAILGPLVLGTDVTTLHLEDALLPPSSAHLMGTDNFGRDVLARVVNGALVDLQIGFFSVVPALCIGMLIGGLAAYYGGWADVLAMRLADIVVAFPFFVLVIAIVAVLGPGLTNMYIAVAAVGWTAYARLVRSEVLVAKQAEYVDAARALGYSDRRIILRHLVPNVGVQALIFATSDFVLDILLGSSLGFLGLGAQPPAPEWGVMIADGRNFITQAPWISTFPGLAIVVIGIAFSLLGDGLADYLRVEERR
ncbi:MAG TPA: ABC transporter permease [Candidatus Limnocylindrales bacterium]|nr:ABC transporter permease [Candidatus Limnocylindrales bacterium]